MRRRDFLKTTALGVGAAYVGARPLENLRAAGAERFSAADVVTIGKTGIHTSRLACGTGTVGVNQHSHQSALGFQGLSDLLWRGYEHGLRFFDAHGINPIGSHMDADPDTVRRTLTEARSSGKGIIGMKILGEGDMRTRQDEALKFALSLGILDAFTIGAENANEQADLIRKMAAVNA